MTLESIGLSPSTLVFIVLGLTLVAFIWGRFRYDLVALAALLGSVMLGLVPADDAFAGFGHPAVITVAAVLVLSRGFERSGVVDVIANQVLKAVRAEQHSEKKPSVLHEVCSLYSFLASEIILPAMLRI